MMQIRNRHLAGLGVAACAVCCAAPVLGLLGLATAGAAATAFTFAFAGLAFAVVVAVATIVGLIARRQATRRASACSTPHATVGTAVPASHADLGMPPVYSSDRPAQK